MVVDFAVVAQRVVVVASNTSPHRLFDCLSTPRQQGPHLEEVEFLLPTIFSVFTSTFSSRRFLIAYRLAGATAGICSSRTVRIAYRLLATTTTCLSRRVHIAYRTLATSSILRGPMGTSYVSDGNTAHDGHRPSRFISGTPTGVTTTGTAIMDVDSAVAWAEIEQ